MRAVSLMGLSALLVFAILPQAASGAELQFAVVSMERVFDEYHKTKAINARFKTRADEADIEHRKFLSNVKTLKKELETLNVEADDDSLSVAEQKKKRRLVKEKFNQYKDAEDQLIEFDKSYTKETGREMRLTQDKLVKDIRDTIQRYIKGKGIIMVLDSSGKTMNRVESVVYFDQALDITDDIIALLNKNVPDSTLKK